MLNPASVKATGVGSRAQIHHAVLPRLVGGGRSNFLDQRRTRHFDRDTRQHGARCVTHDAGDRTLRGDHPRHGQEPDDDEQFQRRPAHTSSLATRVRYRNGELVIAPGYPWTY